MLNTLRRDSKDFQIPDESFLHRRRPSGVDSNTQSEDDESVAFEVRTRSRDRTLNGCKFFAANSTDIGFVNLF